MAYLDLGDAALGGHARTAADAVDGFSPLEWQAIALGLTDSVRTLRAPGPLGRLAAALFGARRSQRLASPGLEALRRMAALARAGRVTPDERAAFAEHGFSTAQADMIVAHAGAR